MSDTNVLHAAIIRTLERWCWVRA